MAKIKKTFNAAATAATTAAELNAALQAAAQEAEESNSRLKEALTEAVAGAGAANYPLDAARAAIGTALAAGRAEVRLNHARAGARLEARDFDNQLKKLLTAAKTVEDVTQVLGTAEKKS